MAQLKNPRLLSSALLVLTLAAGFLGGMAWQKRQVAAALAEEARSRGDGGQEGRRMVIDEVGLEPERRVQVDEIIRHFRARMRALDEEFQGAYAPRQRALIRSTRDSIKSVLSPAQEATYDSLLAVRYQDRNRDGERSSREDRRDGGRSGSRGGR